MAEAPSLWVLRALQPELLVMGWEAPTPHARGWKVPLSGAIPAPVLPPLSCQISEVRSAAIHLAHRGIVDAKSDAWHTFPTRLMLTDWLPETGWMLYEVRRRNVKQYSFSRSH